MKNKLFTILVFVILCTLLSGCPLVRATGDTVEAAGEGVGHIVEGTGNAIGRAAHEIAPR